MALDQYTHEKSTHRSGTPTSYPARSKVESDPRCQLSDKFVVIVGNILCLFGLLLAMGIEGGLVEATTVMRFIVAKARNKRG